MNLADLKQHIESWATASGLTVEHEYYKAVASFAQYIEADNKIQDAIALLQASGYTVVKA